MRDEKTKNGHHYFKTYLDPLKKVHRRSDDKSVAEPHRAKLG